jgi:class 3 adenylate cyclase
VTGISYTDPSLAAVRVGRFGRDERTFIGSLAGREDIRAATAEGEVRPSTHWADPVWDPQLGATLVTVRRPIRRDGAYIGLLMIGVSLADLSAFLSDLYIDTGMAAFILYDEEHVIAHRSLTRQDFEFAADERVPLPRRSELGDPVLAGPWDTEPSEELPGLVEFQLAGFEDAAGEAYVILTRPSISYGSRPWTLGIVFPASEVTDEIERFATAMAAGLAVLVVSLLAAFLIGRSISRKIRRLADAASSLSTLDIADAPRLPDSRIRELASAAAAFNAMVSGLQWFETYVPRSLVLRLIRSGAGTSVASEERRVTVMFTDIEGFSEVSRRLSAAATADLLNRHFSLLARAIEEEGGTVDKFIGDAVMAFWGAPEEQSDHAARALRAAAAIGRAIRLENLGAAVSGGRRLRLRIGLHSGPVVVGNIGSESRINFTIVGETVNVAARLEELGKQLDDGRDVVILASAATARIARYAVPMTPLGPHHLRGQPDPVEVFRVDWAG